MPKKRPTQKDKLNMIIGMLIEAHELLSRTDLDMQSYQPISTLLNKSKLVVTEIITGVVVI